MSEARAGENLGDLVREFDPVPGTPREEIWAGVAAARRFRTPVRSPRRQGVTWGLSLAAMLMLGFVLGRIWSIQPAGSVRPEAPRDVAATTAVRPTSPPNRLAAADYLARTEQLLAEFPSGATNGVGPEVAAWAKQLLLDTRLLIDSPTGADPGIGPLLKDLELVLAQIASLREGDDQQEIRLIVDGIQQNRVMARLRVAAGANGDD